MENIVNEIKQIDKDITNHFFIVNEVKNRSKNLPVLISSTDFVENCPNDLRDLIMKMDEKLCGYFINNQGGLSNHYFYAKRQGLHLRVGEKDSFGRLSSVYTSLDYNWRIVYG